MQHLRVATFPVGLRPLAPGDVVRISAEGPFALAPVINPVV